MNPAVVDFFLRRYGVRGEWVLAIGCGSGAGALASAFLGMNSISMDTRKDFVSLFSVFFLFNA